MHLTQPHLIDQTTNDLWLNENGVKLKDAPTASSKLMSIHSSSPDFDGHFDHQSAIGKSNCLEKGTRSDIACAVHQCARFATCPQKEHGEALKWLGKPLKATREKGFVAKPNCKKELDVESVSFGVVSIATRSETAPRKPERVSEVGIELATARTFCRPRRLIQNHKIVPEAMENSSDCIFKTQGTLLLKQTLSQWIVDPTDHMGDPLGNFCRQQLLCRNVGSESAEKVWKH